MSAAEVTTDREEAAAMIQEALDALDGGGIGHDNLCRVLFLAGKEPEARRAALAASRLTAALRELSDE